MSLYEFINNYLRGPQLSSDGGTWPIIFAVVKHPIRTHPWSLFFSYCETRNFTSGKTLCVLPFVLFCASDRNTNDSGLSSSQHASNSIGGVYLLHCRFFRLYRWRYLTFGLFTFSGARYLQVIRLWALKLSESWWLWVTNVHNGVWGNHWDRLELVGRWSQETEGCDK